jgi:5-methylcytosine-specific restriction endonuclease McrA
LKSTCRSCQREYRRDWRLRNVERERAKSLVWYCENTERAQRNHRDNPERVRINLARRRATLLAAATAEFTPKQLAQRWAYYGDKCWICRAEATETDHVKPLTKGGTHMLCNLRPICSSCNYRKRDRWPLALVMERFAA